MDRKSILCVLVIALAPLPCFAKGMAELKSKKGVEKQSGYPIHLKVPNNWERIDDPAQLPEKVKLLYVGSGKGQFTPSINLACEETKMSLTEYLDLAKNYHEGQPETNVRRAGTLETKSGMAELLHINQKSAWGDLCFLQAAIVCNGTAYVITATATREEFAPLYPAFCQAIQSFTLPH